MVAGGAAESPVGWKVRPRAPDGELGVNVGLNDVKAFQEGSVGWAAGRVPVRMIAVLHRENGEWKTVQTHDPRIDRRAQ